MDEGFTDCIYEEEYLESTESTIDNPYEEHMNSIYQLAVNLQKYCKNQHIHLFNKPDVINIIMDNLS